MNTLRRALEQSPTLVKVMGGAASTNAGLLFASTPMTMTRRSYSSLYECGYLPRYRSSFREASPYDTSVVSASSSSVDNEQDPRDYGYRVATPRSFSTSAAGMTESSTGTHVMSVTQQTTTMTPSPFPPVDEYAFIMSSSEPVSAEECQEVIASRQQEVADAPDRPNTTMTTSASSVLDSTTESSDRWYDHGVDDIDMALD